MPHSGIGFFVEDEPLPHEGVGRPLRTLLFSPNMQPDGFGGQSANLDEKDWLRGQPIQVRVHSVGVRLLHELHVCSRGVTDRGGRKGDHRE